MKPNTVNYEVELAALKRRKKTKTRPSGQNPGIDTEEERKKLPQHTTEVEILD